MRNLWLLNELGCEFEVNVYPFDKTLRGAEFLALNPAGRVPALELDGQQIWESGAITEVLCEHFADTEAGRRLWRAPGDPERADWLIWLHFSETISQHTAALTQQHVALYEDSMRSPIITRLEAKRLEKCLIAVDARLQDRAYLLDGGFSAADISVGQAVYMGRHFVRLDPFEALSDWYGRLSARPAFRASEPDPGAAGLYPRDFFEPIAG